MATSQCQARIDKSLLPTLVPHLVTAEAADLIKLVEINLN
jgi:hypothetical protein